MCLRKVGPNAMTNKNAPAPKPETRPISDTPQVWPCTACGGLHEKFTKCFARAGTPETPSALSAATKRTTVPLYGSEAYEYWQETAILGEELAKAKEGLAWFAECVIRERGGTPDPEGWINKAFEMADARMAEVATLREKLSTAERERDEWIEKFDDMRSELNASLTKLEAAEAELARVTALLGRVVEFDAVRHILGLNHRYESGCNCEMCEVEAALQERERKGE
jgi:hypothetical protein